MATGMIGPKFYGWDDDGKPLAGGLLYTYSAGTNIDKATYTTETMTTENDNPVTLNAEGYADVYLDGSYKMVLKDSNDNEIWTSDPVSSATAQEWVNCHTAEYVSPSSFKIAGNVTDVYIVGRRVRINNDVVDYSYSDIQTSVYSAGETVVTIVNPYVQTSVIGVCTSIISPNSITDTSGSPFRFDNVTKLIDGDYIGRQDFSPKVIHVDGAKYQTGQTDWEVTTVVTPISLGAGLYLKSNGDVYVVDFIDGTMTTDQYVTMANDFCNADITRNRLVFDGIQEIEFSVDAYFDIFVESGGWFCTENCLLSWAGSPTAGYAMRVKGRYKRDESYNTRLDNSNYTPMTGFTIGKSGQQREGVGLEIGYTDAWQTSTNELVTSKFKLERVNVFEFDTVVRFWSGVWACELHHVNTIGGSWETPSFFNGLDYGENIKLNHCFIADNHIRIVDGLPGTVVFSSGEFIIHGGSFDNMKVTVEGDATIKMVTPHFENPFSTDKNKRFLEVIGDNAYCALDSPTIVMRQSEVYNTLFYCEAGTSGNKGPYAGGLVINSPNYQSNGFIRPDLASRKSAEEGETYDGDDYLELVGGGGRVYNNGGVAINSLFVNFNPIPLARNLVGASVYNHSFELSALGTSPKGWVVDTVSPNTGPAVVSDDFNWVGGQCLKTTVDFNGGSTFNSSNVYQEIACKNGQLLVGSLKLRWVTELTNGATGDVTGEVITKIEFYNRMGELIDTQSFSAYAVNGDSNGTDYDWITKRFTTTAPVGTETARIVLQSYSTSDSEDKKIHTYYDTVVLNAL